MAKLRKSAAAKRNTGPTAKASDAPRADGWPAGFASPRDTVLVLLCLVLWGGALAVLAGGNNLLGLKQVLLIIAGVRLEPLLAGEALHSIDMAVVLFGAMLILAGSYIHVSIGLAAVLALRPWLDGFTYPADNTYFLWACLYLMGLWALRQFREPKPFRGALPLGLLAAYIAWCALSAATAIQLNTTLYELLLWVGYAALFLVALNGTPTPPARAIVLLGLLAGVAGQALFAYPHLAYVLPWLRQTLQADPELLAHWFKGATEFTPELARRFNLNRAFASMVFPNALAALLLLGIAPTLALAVDGWRRLLHVRGQQSGPERPHFGLLLMVAVPVFAATALTVFALGTLAIAYGTGDGPWFASYHALSVMSALVAAVPVLCFLIAARIRGLGHGLCVLQTLAATVFVPLMAGALWITYSRGAMLALAVSFAVAALVLWRGRRNATPETPPEARGALAGVLMLGLALSIVAAALPAPAEPAETAASTVSAEGMDVTVAELVNPASFAARIGYWRIALKIAADNPLFGVGLGNFGMAYGPAQDLDAGDVRNAHSVVLQTLCETGIPGLFLFAAFWGVFLWRAWSYLPGMLRSGHVVTVGLAVGLLAFLIHALIDINFSHPSLVMMALAALGLFYSGLPDGGAAAPGRYRAGAALALVVVAALGSGLAMRPYVHALGLNGGRMMNVSNRAWLDTRQQAAVFFLADCAAWGRAGKEGTPPRIPLARAVSLIPEREFLTQFGQILAPDTERKAWVAVGPAQPLPPNGLLEIRRPWDTHAFAMARVEQWAEELAFVDARFPYDPEVAMTLSRVYKVMVEQASEKQRGRREAWIASLTAWGEEAVARSPLHKDMHENLAWVYWSVASQREGRESLDYYLRALESFRRARELGHLEPRYYFAHAGALDALGRSYRNQGLEDHAATYRAEAEAVRAQGEDLQAARWERGLQ